MLKYLVVLFLFPFGALAADGRPILPDPPFQIVNQEQVGVYHAALRGVFPGLSDKSIAAKISEAQSVLLRRANELLAEVQFRQDLPYRPVRIEWSLVGPNIGEAYPVFIRLNLITALQDPEIFHASVVPHEIAHLLYFQKYGCRKDEWIGNARHDDRFAAIMEDLVGFAERQYTEKTVESSSILTTSLAAVAGEHQDEWLAQNGLEIGWFGIVNNSVPRVLSIISRMQQE